MERSLLMLLDKQTVLLFITQYRVVRKIRLCKGIYVYINRYELCHNRKKYICDLIIACVSLSASDVARQTSYYSLSLGFELDKNHIQIKYLSLI